MASQRGRAWRRRQREKYIRRREHLLYDAPDPTHMLVWQLWINGEPTDVLHKQRSPRPVEELPPDKVVGVDIHTHYWGHRYERVREERIFELPDGSVVTSLGIVNKCVYKPPTGSVWKCIRHYTIEHRGLPRGQLDKSRNPKDAASTHWQKPHGKDKRWKLMAGRSSKVARARALGRGEYDLHNNLPWRDWADADV